MILDTTYTDKEVTKAINSAVGKPFSLWDRIKLGGIGSHRIQIEKASENLSDFYNPGLSVNNINIELRPKGIIIHLKRRTQTYAWVIPYAMLEISDDCSYISDGTYNVTLNDPMAHNEKFFEKLNALNN